MSLHVSNYSLGEYLFSITITQLERYLENPKYYKMNSKILKDDYSNITINHSQFIIHDNSYINKLEHTKDFIDKVNEFINELKCSLDMNIFNTEQEIEEVAIDKVSCTSSITLDDTHNMIQLEPISNTNSISSSVDNKVIPNQIISSKKPQDINTLSDKDKYILLKKNPEYIKYLNNPSTSILETLINDNPLNIQYIENPNTSLRKKAIKNNPYSILYINNLNINKILRNVKYYSKKYLNKLSDNIIYTKHSNVTSLEEFDMIEDKATNVLNTSLAKYYLENNYFIKCKIKSDNIYCIYFYGQWLIQVNNNSNLTIDEFVDRYYNNIDYLSLLNVMEYYHKHDMTIYKMVI